MPVYERLQGDARLANRVRDILVSGVSTRKYARVLPKMAGTVGVSKSSVSREFIKANAQSLQALMGRCFDGWAIARARHQDPLGYIRVIASLMPKELETRQDKTRLTTSMMSN